MRIAILHTGAIADLASVAERYASDLPLAVELDVRQRTDAKALAAAIRGEGGRSDAVVLTAGALGEIPEVVRAARDLQCPIVTVEPALPVPTGARDMDRIAVARVHGRGVDSYRSALAHVVARTRWPVVRYRYGPDPEQDADLRLPRAPGPLPVAVLIHGGFWRAHWGKDLMDGLALDLTQRGWATWNIEYRRVGCRGGWPTTIEDVMRAVEALQDLAGAEIAEPDASGTPSMAPASPTSLDLDRVVLIGHSAGGHLALVTATALTGQAEGGNGDRSRVRPRFVVSLAGVADLDAAAAAGIGENAVREFLGGGPDEVGERYRAASPHALLPLGVRQLLVHGDADDRVPVDQSRRYYTTAVDSGDPIELLELPGVDHFEVIDAESKAWKAVERRLADDIGG